MWVVHCVHILLTAAILASCALKYDGGLDFLQHSSELEKAGVAILIVLILAGIKGLISEFFAAR
jgi:hypothetical protein